MINHKSSPEEYNKSFLPQDREIISEAVNKLLSISDEVLIVVIQYNKVPNSTACLYLSNATKLSIIERLQKEVNNSLLEVTHAKP